MNIITLNELTSGWSGKASLMPLPPGLAMLCSLYPKAEHGAGRAAGSPAQEAAQEQSPAHLFPSRAHICSCGLVCGVLLQCSAWGAWACGLPAQLQAAPLGHPAWRQQLCQEQLIIFTLPLLQEHAHVWDSLHFLLQEHGRDVLTRVGGRRAAGLLSASFLPPESSLLASKGLKRDVSLNQSLFHLELRVQTWYLQQAVHHARLGFVF